MNLTISTYCTYIAINWLTLCNHMARDGRPLKETPCNYFIANLASLSICLLNLSHSLRPDICHVVLYVN